MLSWSDVSVRQSAYRLALRALLWVGVPVMTLAVAAGRAKVPPTLAIVAVAGALLAAWARRRPVPALLIGSALGLVVPYYDGRLVTRAVAITPVGAMCLLLLPAAWDARRRVRLGPIDVVFAALVLFRVLSLLLNFSKGTGGSLTLALQIALPYAVLRVLGLDEAVSKLLAGVVGAVGVGLSVVGIREHTGHANPFFTLLPAQYQASQWAHPELRESTVRAEASFGHPIPFGMFLVVALLMLVVAAVSEGARGRRLASLAGAGVVLLGLADTLSRGPLVVAALALVAWVLASARRLNMLRVAVLSGALVAAVLVTPVLGTVQRLVADSHGDSRTAASAAYRLEILSVAKDPAEFSFLGRSNGQGDVTDALTARTGLKSVDSEFALEYLSSGALALAALVVLALLLVRAALLPNLDVWDRAWAVVMVGLTMNLLTVALLTQLGEFYWAWVGLTASIMQRASGKGRLTMTEQASVAA